MKNNTTLPLPDNYDSEHAFDDSYYVGNYSNLHRSAVEWKFRHELTPVGSDRTKMHLLVIDDQNDFTFPTGTLFVSGRSGTGAMDAQDHLSKFIYRNLHHISYITCTMDTHLPYQIFHPGAHVLEDGSNPEPHTIISAEEYRKGKYQPSPVLAKQLNVDLMWLQRQFIHYCEELEKTGKYQLYIWPYHCLLGSRGHTLSGVIDEARMFHAIARGSENCPAIKGGNPLTEHYSIFSPEVTTCWDGRPIPGAQKNTALIKTLLEYDIVVIAGLAASHCVKESIADFLNEIQKNDPGLAEKVYIMKDCTASVVIPNGPDFTSEAEQAMDAFRNAGMHLVTSDMPLETWPGINLNKEVVK